MQGIGSSFEIYSDITRTINLIYKQIIMYLMIQHHIILNYMAYTRFNDDFQLCERKKMLNS